MWDLQSLNVITLRDGEMGDLNYLLKILGETKEKIVVMSFSKIVGVQCQIS